jgi:hypothetical protein
MGKEEIIPASFTSQENGDEGTADKVWFHGP